MDKYTAVVLAAGAGSRMHSKTKKQYLMLKGKPVLYYSLAAFEKHPGIGEIILVCGEEDISWCRQEIVVKFAFQKIKKIIPGGRERYHSVYEGLKAAGSCDWVLIHDGARPVLDQEILDRVLAALPRYRACVRQYGEGYHKARRFPGICDRDSPQRRAVDDTDASGLFLQRNSGCV